MLEGDRHFGICDFEKRFDFLVFIMSGNSEQLYSIDDVAGLLDVSPHTLGNWRTQGKGPKWFKDGQRIWYPQSALDEWQKIRKLCAPCKFRGR